MEKTPLTTQQVLDLVEPIPADKFCVDEYCNDNDCCCIMGHVNKAIGAHPSARSVENLYNYDLRYNQDIISPAIAANKGLRERSQAYLISIGLNWVDIASVNNHTTGSYQQPTPKERVTALLKDMLAAGY